ncbi:MAG TPA: alpha/beta hydrolase [Galbitalea sp.]|jgi:pimeloyl-ACP methyl ester carboxylesterase
MERRVITTTTGPVEIVLVPGPRPPVLFFPGGHCSAMCDCGWEVYTRLGFGTVSFSRPEYGETHVGALSPELFVRQVREVCEQLDISAVAAAVGVSFGGMQAVHAAGDPALGVPRLVLHGCAPSSLPYPDSRLQAIGAPVLFSPLLQGLVWRLVRRLVGSEAGLRRVMAGLSNLPVDAWWNKLDLADKTELRVLFRTMSSDSGFANDLRQGRARDAADRQGAMSRVRCPTLVTGSRHDGGVSFEHAVDFADVIPNAALIELDSPNHIFWIGPGRAELRSVVAAFMGESSCE